MRDEGLMLPRPEPHDTRPWRWRKCKSRDCGRLFDPRRSSSTRFCPSCVRERKLARKKQDKRKREIAYPSLKRKQWEEKRRQSTFLHDTVCWKCRMPEKEQKKRFHTGFTTDHVIPARFVVSIGKDPHAHFNLVPLCGDCNPLKVGAEVKLFLGDVYGFVSEMRQNGFPMDKLKKVFELYELETERLPWPW